MALPVTRDEFKAYVLRRLGDGAIKVNVTDAQVEDRVNFAVHKAMDYHFDYMEVAYIATQVSANNITNKYIEMPNNVMGVVEIFPLTSTMMGSGMFSADYQFVMDNFQNWTTMSLQPYFIAFQNLKLIQDLLVGQQPIRYNRFINKLHIDMNWNRVVEGSYILARAYKVLDPDTYTRLWADTWLTEYTTAQIKQQWGENMKKYDGMPLPGGLKMSGQKIFDEATDEIKRLEDELINTYSIPATMFVG